MKFAINNQNIIPEQQKEVCWGDFVLLISRKAIRHIYLQVCPESGRVLVSAPLQAEDREVMETIARKSNWLHKQMKLRAIWAKPAEPQYQSGEIHPFLGKEYSLFVQEERGAGQIRLNTSGCACNVATVLNGQSAAGEIIMRAPPGSGQVYRKNLLLRWYRAELARLVKPLFLEWQSKMGVRAHELRIRRMRSRWGSCNTLKGRIWLSLELAKKDPACIEYVLVHELAHLIERGHNQIFWAVVEKHLPEWKKLRAELNARPTLV